MTHSGYPAPPLSSASSTSSSVLSISSTSALSRQAMSSHKTPGSRPHFIKVTTSIDTTIPSHLHSHSLHFIVLFSLTFLISLLQLAPDAGRNPVSVDKRPLFDHDTTEDPSTHTCASPTKSKYSIPSSGTCVGCGAHHVPVRLEGQAYSRGEQGGMGELLAMQSGSTVKHCLVPDKYLTVVRLECESQLPSQFFSLKAPWP